MEKQTNDTTPTQTSQGGEGRISQTGDNKSNQGNSQQDISQVDRQEGEMNNGETGGNFRDGSQNKESESR